MKVNEPTFLRYCSYIILKELLLLWRTCRMPILSVTIDMIVMSSSFLWHCLKRAERVGPSL